MAVLLKALEEQSQHLRSPLQLPEKKLIETNPNHGKDTVYAIYSQVEPDRERGFRWLLYTTYAPGCILCYKGWCTANMDSKV